MKVTAAGTFAIIGAGRIGSGYAQLLVSAGHTAAAVVDRNPLHREKLIRLLQADAASCATDLTQMPATVDWFIVSVPDGAIAQAAAQIRAAGIVRPGQVFLHASGALPSAILQPAAAVGAAVGSLHPLRTVPDPERALAALSGAVFSFEGDPRARDLAEILVGAADGQLLTVSAGDKPLYHAAACLVSNYVVALMGAADGIFAGMGIDEEWRRKMIGDLAGAAVANATRAGSAAALTGPVARGDAETIALHLAALKQAPGHVRAAYIALAEVAAGLLPRSDPRLARLLAEARADTEDSGGRSR